jgi:hypothetical protein
LAAKILKKKEAVCMGKNGKKRGKDQFSFEDTITRVEYNDNLNNIQN